MPNANYSAIYLTEQDFPSLLLGISIKLRVHISMISTVYYYDQHMTPVVVNENSIGSLSHEQDLIVQLPWVANQPSTYSHEADSQGPFIRDASSVSTYPSLHEAHGTSNEYTLGDHHDGMFDQYLALPPEDSYGASIDSWSEFSEDTSMSMSQMFAQCSTAKTTISDHEVQYQEESFHHRLVLGDQGTDHAGYAFDSAPSFPMPTICLSSVPAPDTLKSSVPILDPQQVIAPQPDSLQFSTAGEQLVDSAPHVNKDPMTKKPLSHRPRKEGPERPASLRRNNPSPSTKTNQSDSDTSKQSKADKRMLERNRLAAVKCRHTRKEKEARLQELTREKSELNAELKLEVSRLKAQVAEARGLLKRHVGCT